MAHSTPSVVVQASGGFSSNTATTGSFTPSTGDLLLAAGFQSCNASASGAAGKPTITDSLGKIWTEIVSVLDPLSDQHLALWSHLVTESSPASRTVTTTEIGGTGGGPHAASLVVFKSNGAQVRLVSGSPNKGIASVGSGGDPSGSLDNASLSTSTVISVAVNLSNADFTPSAGQDFLDYDSTGNPRWGAAYRVSSTSASFGFTSTSAVAVAVAVEIEDAVSPAGFTLPRSRMGTRWMTSKRF